MKRRNVEICSTTGKLRRVTKRGKPNDANNVFANFKFLLVWITVLILDFVSEFRFELLYPFWVFLCNINDTFRFKGVSYLFSYVFITLTIDMICYYFIPIHWLFFASSTYVWLQFTWHSDRTPTWFSLCIWTMFICMEGFLRMKQLKSLPFQFEICRPFAAHGIGFPILTFGVGCKSYIHYRLRFHRREFVAKENEFYYTLLTKGVYPASNGVVESGGSGATGGGGDMVSKLDYALSSPTSLSSQNTLTASDNELSISLNSSSSGSSPSSSSSSSPSRGTNQYNNNNNSNVSTISYAQNINGGHNTNNNITKTTTIFNSSSITSLLTARRNSSNSHNNSLTDKLQQHLRTLSTRMKSGTIVPKVFLNFFENLFQYLTTKFFSNLKFSNQYHSRSNCNSSVVFLFKVLVLHSISNAFSWLEKLWESLSFRKFHFEKSIDSSSATNFSTNQRCRLTALQQQQTLNHNQENSNHQPMVGGAEINEINHSKPSNHQNGGSTKTNENRKSNSKSRESNSINSANGYSRSAPTDDIVFKSNGIFSDDISPSTTTSTSANNKSSDQTLNSSQNVKQILSGKNTGHFGKKSKPSSSTFSSSSIISKNHQDTENLLDLLKTKDDQIWKLEVDHSRLKSDFQTVRQCEKDLRDQLNSAKTEEKFLRQSIETYRCDIETMQKKLQTYSTIKQQDKQSIQKLEKQLEDEKRKSKQSSELQAASERKAQMAEENAARASAMVAEVVRNVSASSSCSLESCRTKQREYEYELNSLRKELLVSEEQIRLKNLMQNKVKEMESRVNLLISALSKLDENNRQLEENLNMEKLLKIELCKTLDGVKRQCHRQRELCSEQEKEIRELKSQISFINAPSLVSSSVVGSAASKISSHLNHLNGFVVSNGSASSSTANALNHHHHHQNDLDLMNRCFSSCSPTSIAVGSVSTVSTAASPSSLSSNTPPLIGENSSRSATFDAISPTGSSSSGSASSFMLPPQTPNVPSSCANAVDAFEQCLNWPNSGSILSSNQTGSNSFDLSPVSSVTSSNTVMSCQTFNTTTAGNSFFVVDNTEDDHLSFNSRFEL